LKTKIQKILTILFTIPVIFGVFGSVVFAKDICSTESDCKIKLEKAEEMAEEYQKRIRELRDIIDSIDITDYSDAGYYSSSKEELDTKIAALQKLHKEEIAPLKIRIRSLQSADSSIILNTTGQTQFGNLSDFIGGAIDILVKMVAVVAFAFLIVGGFRLVAAAGNDNEIQKAKTMITYSIIGLVLVLLAYVIVLIVQTVLYHES